MLDSLLCLSNLVMRSYTTTDDHIFHPYTRTAPQGNARRIIDPDTNTAHLIASKAINVSDEIIIIHRSIVVRAASVSDDRDMEHKYDEDEAISNTTSSFTS